MDPMRRRHTQRGRSPSVAQDVSSISSMDSSAKRKPPPELGAASTRSGAGEAIPLIPNYVMSPGDLAGDLESQREVRVDDEVCEPMYGSLQAEEEGQTTTLASQRSRSSPPRPTPARPVGLPSGQGTGVDVPRPATLPQVGGRGDADDLGGSSSVDRMAEGALPGTGLPLDLDQSSPEGEPIRGHGKRELDPEELHPDYAVALGEGQVPLESMTGARAAVAPLALNRVIDSEAGSGSVKSGARASGQSSPQIPKTRTVVNEPVNVLSQPCGAAGAASNSFGGNQTVLEDY